MFIELLQKITILPGTCII